MTAPPKCTGGAITIATGAIITIATMAGVIAAGVTAGADAQHFELETHRPAARRACCFVIRLSRNRSSAPDSLTSNSQRQALTSTNLPATAAAAAIAGDTRWVRPL